LERLPSLEAARRLERAFRCGSLWPSEGFLNGGGRAWLGLGGFQSGSHERNIFLHGRKPVSPMSAQLRVLADGDVRLVNSFGAIRQPGPAFGRLAVLAQRLFEGGAVAGFFVDPVEHSAAELRREE